MKYLTLKASLLLLPLTLAACAGGPEHPPCPMDDRAPMHGMSMPGMGMPLVKPTGDADVDFVRGMIPHHQMAVDESEKYLAVGRDAEIRRLAGHIKTSQQHEIAMMNDWLDKRGMAVDDNTTGMRNDTAPDDMKPMPENCDMPRHHHMMHHHAKMGADMQAPVIDPRAAAAPNMVD